MTNPKPGDRIEGTFDGIYGVDVGEEGKSWLAYVTNRSLTEAEARIALLRMIERQFDTKDDTGFSSFARVLLAAPAWESFHFYVHEDDKGHGMLRAARSGREGVITAHGFAFGAIAGLSSKLTTDKPLKPGTSLNGLDSEGTRE